MSHSGDGYYVPLFELFAHIFFYTSVSKSKGVGSEQRACGPLWNNELGHPVAARETVQTWLLLVIVLMLVDAAGNKFVLVYIKSFTTPLTMLQMTPWIAVCRSW